MDITIDIHNYPSNVTRQDIMDMLMEMDRKEAEVIEQLEDDLRVKDEYIDDLKSKHFQV